MDSVDFKGTMSPFLIFLQDNLMERNYKRQAIRDFFDFMNQANGEFVMSHMICSTFKNATNESLQKTYIFRNKMTEIKKATTSLEFGTKNFSLKKYDTPYEAIYYLYTGEANFIIRAPEYCCRTSGEYKYKPSNQLEKFLGKTIKSILGYKVTIETEDLMEYTPGYACFKLFLFNDN